MIDKEFRVRNGLVVNNTLITANVTTGNVGIGTSSPGYKLDVVGTINAANVLVNGAPITGGAGYFQGNSGDKGDASGADIFRVHSNTMTQSVTIHSGFNAIAAGPINIVGANTTLLIQTGARVTIV